MIFNNKKNFFGDFFFATPAIMGFKTGKDLNAGCKLFGN